MNNSVRYIQDKKNEIELITYKSVSYSYPRHNHINMYSIGILLSGELSLSLNDTDISCQIDSPFIIPPYAPHSITAKSNYDMLMLCVNKNAFVDPHFKTNFSVFIKKALSKNHITDYEYKILEEYFFSLKIQDISVEDLIPCITKNIQQLEHCPEQDFKIDDMAKATNFSKYYFIRKFKEEVGLTPHQFQTQNKIRKAQRKLKENQKITEVALDTGFYDQSHFIRHFEKNINLSPSVYKKCCIDLDD